MTAHDDEISSPIKAVTQCMIRGLAKGRLQIQIDCAFYRRQEKNWQALFFPYIEDTRIFLLQV